MPEPELSLLFIRPLNRLGLRYFVSGSVAATLYGEPRLTHDVDFVVYLRADDVPGLREMFFSPEFYLPPPEAIRVEIARERRGHFNAIHTESGFKADFYPAGRDEFHAWAFRHARRLDYRGEPMIVAPPEYVIVRKLNTSAKAALRNTSGTSDRCGTSPGTRSTEPHSMNGLADRVSLPSGSRLFHDPVG